MKTVIILISLVATACFSQDIKSFGRADTQTIVSLRVEDDGQINTASLRPPNAGDDWQPPVIVPLVKVPQPNDGKFYEPNLVWFADRVERRWIERAQTPAEAAAAADKTERQEIKALMADIKAGTGTNGERIARIEKALHRLLKDTLR